MNQKLKHEPHKDHSQNIKSFKIHLIIISDAAQTVNSYLTEMENSGKLQLSDDDFTGF